MTPKGQREGSAVRGGTELRAVWNCGGSGVRAVLEEIEEALYFELLAFDCDNGPEFLNQPSQALLRTRAAVAPGALLDAQPTLSQERSDACGAKELHPRATAFGSRAA
jgi:hypothetical protein